MMDILDKFENSLTHNDSTLSHNDSAVGLNESFVNLSNISNLQSSGQLTNIKTSIKKQKTSQPKRRKQIRDPTRYNLRGISSFKGFELSSPSNSLFLKSFELKSPETDSFTTKENKQNAQVSYPNILKHGKKETALKSTSTPNSSPLKVLEFSPSRFLNTSSEDLKTEAIGLDVVRELSFSSFDVEDSGISGSDVDVSTPISPPSLTSTPKGKKSRRKESLTFLNIFSSPELTRDESLMNTPLINRYLNESTPLTPTPFKCPLSKTDDCENPNCLDCEELLSPSRNFRFKKPSPVSASWSSNKRRPITRPSNLKKTARKVLLLEQEPDPPQNNDVLASRIMKMTPEPTFLRLTPNIPTSVLVGDQATVEKHNQPGNKSVYRTRQRKSGRLDSHWVSVACGRSVDQKTMTEAAKRCLRRRTPKKYF